MRFFFTRNYFSPTKTAQRRRRQNGWNERRSTEERWRARSDGPIEIQEKQGPNDKTWWAGGSGRGTKKEVTGREVVEVIVIVEEQNDGEEEEEKSNMWRRRVTDRRVDIITIARNRRMSRFNQSWKVIANAASSSMTTGVITHSRSRR